MKISTVKTPTSKKGFTLIELLVVIAIIALLASIVMASLNQARSKSRDGRRIADIKQLQLALSLYYNDKSTYPAPDLRPLSPDYITTIPQDPNGVAYKYQSLDSTAAVCAATPCPSYVLGATLENTDGVLLTDTDDKVADIDCTDATFNFCVQP